MGIAVVIFLIVILMMSLLLVLRSRDQGDTTVWPQLMASKEANSDPQIHELLRQDKKIEAIKRYRELTGLGLKEAKDAVEYLQMNPDALSQKKKKTAYDTQDAGLRDLIQEGKIDEAVEVYQKFAGVDEYTAQDVIAEIERDLQSGEDEISRLDEAPIQDLLRQGKKIEAIKRYREQTGLGLKEAKDAVDALERKQR